MTDDARIGEPIYFACTLCGAELITTSGHFCRDCIREHADDGPDEEDYEYGPIDV